MAQTSKRWHAQLLSGAAAAGILSFAGAAFAQDANFNIPRQQLSAALKSFSEQSGNPVLYLPEITALKVSPGATGRSAPDTALDQVLAGTGLSYRREGTAYLIVQAGEGGSNPQDAGAADDDAVEALIVTAQKREEAIQDVPIAISAFSAKALEEQKIEGGFDLLKAIPNVTFSKSNFTSYNFSIRGVGTKAVSATTDPGVAVAFNNTTLIQNRLFEQEYFDVERVEVLRGPQGTLYGRNATSGVINVISAKPKLSEFEASAKFEIGNYDSRRLVGMMNIPLIEDVLAVRVAGAMTQRSGYDYNEITGNNVNGRDLWSGRMSVGFEPTPALRANLVWERFEEDDNRSRTSKQLCHSDPGRTTFGSVSIVGRNIPYYDLLLPAGFSQACLPGNLYDKGAYDAPNGLALPFIFAPLSLGAACGPGCNNFGTIGLTPDGQRTSFLRLEDPYGGLTQSRDLRTIASIRDPRYRAKADLVDLSVDFDIADALTLSSQTLYNEDEVYSFQDYNRFNTAPAFVDTSTVKQLNDPTLPSLWASLAPGGVFCDPQIGCSDRVATFDISQSSGKQFSQEFRLQSDFDGAVNFSFGANYTKFETIVDYYVFSNLLTGIALTYPFYIPLSTGIDLTICPRSGASFGITDPGNGPVPAGDPTANCPYIDPNPIESINGEGHNYFRSKNPYKLASRALFGEVYWNIDENLKVTAGLRYTEDRKTFIPVPSQLLLAPGYFAGGNVTRGLPEDPPIKQEWGEFSGRLGLDWKTQLPFTDETMLYGFYSRGYKGGGANPPTPDFATREESLAFFIAHNGDQFLIDQFSDPDHAPLLQLAGVEYGPTFEPEFVNAFEIGAKNTLLGGAMTFNATGFFYDYMDYQVSQIRDRTAVNENFDATIWGLEFETTFAPSRDLKFNANLGYLKTKIADGETSIDIMNRTQGNPDYALVKPWVQLPSNCIIPVAVIEAWFLADGGFVPCTRLGGAAALGGWLKDPNFGDQDYDPANYPEINGGAGIRQQLGGNELPNAPHWTMNAGAQYGRDILDGSWRVNLRGDAYWQSQSWARVYNAVNDKLHGWYNFNVAVTLENRDLGFQAEFYVKNLLDKSPITDAFLNSDDTGLTTNVFVLDPRIVGFNVRKTF